MLSEPRRADAVGTALTLATGASDAISFMRLGNVFASVMTGNLALLGVSVARGTGALAAHTGLAIGSFAAGGLLAAFLTKPKALRGAAAEGPGGPGPGFPAIATLLLGLEALMWVAVLVLWERSRALPLYRDQYVLLGLMSFEMGLQSGIARAMGALDISTTYLTGTLAQVTYSLGGRLGNRAFHGPGQPSPELRDKPSAGLGAQLRRPLLALCAMLAGAAAAAGLVVSCARVAPLLPLGAVVLAGVLSYPARPR